MKRLSRKNEYKSGCPENGTVPFKLSDDYLGSCKVEVSEASQAMVTAGMVTAGTSKICTRESREREPSIYPKGPRKSPSNESPPCGTCSQALTLSLPPPHYFRGGAGGKLHCPRPIPGDILLTSPRAEAPPDTMLHPMPPMPSVCLLYTSPSPRDGLLSRMPSSA